jgi:hypothetical protein
MKPIRVKLAAERFGIPVKTLYSWHYMRKYPKLIFKLGALLMLDEDELVRMSRDEIGQNLKRLEFG